MRTSSYNKPHCWQYEVRINNLREDLKKIELTKEDAEKLRIRDFKFFYVQKSDQKVCGEIKQFIERHEWLGKMPHRPTHRFIATYKGTIAGVVIMAIPNAFSNLLGKENQGLEKLISRGACISWSPKNLASALVTFSIRWMVKNTEFRFFTAYSDTEARELGTIYQACNFTYLGQGSGARHKYFDPLHPEKGWFSDRNFRKMSAYKRYAVELGIDWQKSWNKRDKVHWHKIPENICQKLKAASQDHQERCKRLRLPPKHKYVFIKGSSRGETRRLRELFRANNPKLVDLPYPKMRGPQQNDLILNQELTVRPDPCWPNRAGATEPKKKLFSIKEVSEMYGISHWLLYGHIKSDPTFPFVNVGAKKKYLVHLERFEAWLEKRSQVHRLKINELPSTDDLLEVS